MTRLCPTVITNSSEVLDGRFNRAAARLRARAVGRSRLAPGFHLEGPYIAAEDGPRGAHPKEHVRPPDWGEFERFQAAAGGRIRLITLAPELPGAIDFIRRTTARGRDRGDRSHYGIRTGNRRRGCGRRAAEYAPGQRCAPHAPSASELHLGAAGRFAPVSQRDRRRFSPPALGFAVDHPRQGSPRASF